MDVEAQAEAGAEKQAQLDAFTDNDSNAELEKSAAKQMEIDKLTDDRPAYIESRTFTGSKTGYVFTTGIHGIGYYRDSSAQVEHLPGKTEEQQTKHEAIVESSKKEKSRAVMPDLTEEEVWKKEEQDLARTIARAECIVHSLDGVKVFACHGTPSAVFPASKYSSFFGKHFI